MTNTEPFGEKKISAYSLKGAVDGLVSAER